MKPFPAVACVALFAATILPAAPGDLDATFLTGIGAGLTPSSYPTFDGGTGATNAVALQSTGKIIAGGNVSRFNNTGALNSLKRLNADGSLDSTFNSGGAGLADSQGQTEVMGLLRTTGDKLYASGVFTSYNGTTRSGILRLNADGTLDSSFNTVGVSSLSAFSARYVKVIREQADGKILLGGMFYRAGGVVRPALARLNADGSLDTGFTPPAFLDSLAAVTALDVQADGKIVIGGSRYNSATATNQLLLQRLNPDGSHDLTFGVVWENTVGDVDALLALPSGHILIGGNLSLPGTATPVDFLALNPDGTIDQTFTARFGAGPNGWAGGQLQLQPDGKILVGGVFTSWDGQPRASIARLEADGTLDPSFAPTPYLNNLGTSGYLTHLYAFATQPDGMILAGGWFHHISDPNLFTFNLVRFQGDYSSGPGTLRFTAPVYVTNETGSSVAIGVSRFGGLSGAASVDFATTDVTAQAGADYTAASGTLAWAAGEGGVKFITVPLLPDATAEATEALALTLTGATGAALGSPAAATVLIRDDDSPPAITLQPLAVTVDQGDSFTLLVAFDSVLTATVQWYLGNDAIPGATTPAFTVAAADPATHGGTYSVRVTNANGTTTSNAVVVTVKIPAGAVVTSFAPSTSLSSVLSFSLDPAGNILAAGTNSVVRLTAAGVIDTTFAPAFNNQLTNVIALPDGSMLVGGYFTTVNSTAKNYFAHLNANGTLDTATDLGISQAIATMSLGTGSKLYIGHIGSQGLKRYTLAGALDSTFTASTTGTGTSGSTYNVKERADGKVLVAAQAGGLGSVTYQFQLLTSTGTVDSSFNVPALNWNVYDWDTLPDGRLVVVGRFSTVGGVAAQRIVILNADGSRDTSVDFSQAFDGPVLGVRYVNGRILAWGSFTSYKGYAQTGIARLNLDGSRDTTFKVGAGTNSGVNAVLTFADGRHLLGGSFTLVRGLSRSRLALLEAGPGALAVVPGQINVAENAGSVSITVKRFAPASGSVSINYATTAGTATAPDDFTATNGTLTWTNGDVTDRTVTIPVTNDSTGEPLQAFTLALDAASLTGDVTLAIPAATITITDDDNPPAIVTPPAAQTVAQLATATFTVVATSTPAATYRWTFNGTDLADGNGISGSGTATLTIANVGPQHIGAYRVRLTNPNGSVTSDPASLSVNLNPALADYLWPTNLAVNGRVSAIVPLLDGGAYVAGAFTNFAGQTGRSYLVRISANGTVDTNFSPAPNGAISQLLLVGNRLYVLGDPTGALTTIGGGAAVAKFAALDAVTGARDATFMAALGLGANAAVRSLALFPDGDVLLAGDFTSFNAAASHRYVARLNADGSLHTPFDTSAATGSSSVVTAADVGPDGKIVVGGTTISYAGATRFLRLNGDGSRDTTFAPTGATNSTFTRIRVLADGRVMASGSSLPPSNRPLTRLSVTGEWSSTDFMSTTSGTFNDFALQRNGRTVGVGTFTYVRSPSTLGCASNLARFDATGNYEGTWPTGVGLDNTGYVIALAEDGRIWVGGDFTAYNGTAVQRLVRLNGDAIPLAITLQPRPLELNPGATATFSARATGTSAITYQWRRNGTPLADGGRISGAATASLSIASVDESDEGVYTLRVTNASGEEISANAELAVLGAPEILAQPAASVAAYSNRAFSLDASVRGVAPLTYEWRREGVALVEGANGITGTATARLQFTSLAPTHAGNYQLVVTNAHGTASSGLITLAVNPHPLDRATVFSSVNGAASTNVTAILPLADGGALIGGTFNSFSGASSTTSGGRIARVLANGQVAALPFALNGSVYAIHRQADGKFLIGGDFTTLTPTGGSAITRNRVARLNADFTLDASFDVGGGPTSQAVRAIVTDALGRVYVGGSFPTWTNRPTGTYLVRLRPDGSIDPTFSAPLNSTVNDLELDTSGRLMVAGAFSSYQGISYLARLTADGSRDTTFDASAVVFNAVSELQLQPDGKPLVVFTNFGLRRLLTTGANDSTFTATTQSSITTLSLQPDGSIVIGGSFTTYGTPARAGLARVTSSGALEPLLAPAGSNTVGIVRVDGYGRIWVGGNFTSFNSVAVNGLTVLNGDSVPLNIVQQPASLAVSPGQNAALSVVATGTSALSYQWWKNNAPLADGGSVSGATTATLTITGAQAVDAGSYTVEVTNASGTRVSNAATLAVLGQPEVLIAPIAQTIEVGQSATFYVSARGSGTLTYQWLRNGVELTNGGAVSGATTATLTLSNATLPDAGSLVLRITGAGGVTLTQPVVLTVNLNPGGVVRTLSLPTFNSTVSAIRPNSDGTFFAGGLFTTVTWSGGSASRARFAKIKTDGSVDTAWPTFGNGQVYAIATDATGRVYVGGSFTSITPSGGSAVTRNRLVRLNANGTLDTTFNAPGGVAGAGPSGNVKGIKLDTAGRVYIYGDFPNYNGVAAGYVARLNEDGSRDTAFASPLTSFVYDVEFTSDGRLWIGHGGTWSGQSRVVLVDGTGTRDPGFTYSGSLTGFGLILRADDTALNLGTSSPYIQRVSLAGVIDSTFTPAGSGPNGQIAQHAVLADGQFYLQGSFSTYAGVACGNFIRVAANGTRDTTFDSGTGFSGTVDTVVVDAQGRVWVGGSFSSFNGDTNLARLVVLNGGVAQSNSGPPADTLGDFLAAAGVPVGQRGPADDPDHDGISNLLEYALDLSPSVSDAADYALTSATGGRLNFSYRRARQDVTYVVETTATLGDPNSWTTTGVDQGTPDGNGQTMASVALTGTAQFLRLRVSR